jgi:hypothetical protein
VEETVNSPAGIGRVFGVAFLLSASGWAQVAPAPTAGTVEGVVNEIRLLRQAIERQSSSAARAQLLIGRLGLQDQRTARARSAVERLEGELADAQRGRDQLQVAARETQPSLEQACWRTSTGNSRPWPAESEQNRRLATPAERPERCRSGCRSAGG